jgi:hypothetical protein
MDDKKAKGLGRVKRTPNPAQVNPSGSGGLQRPARGEVRSASMAGVSVRLPAAARRCFASGGERRRHRSLPRQIQSQLHSRSRRGRPFRQFLNAFPREIGVTPVLERTLLPHVGEVMIPFEFGDPGDPPRAQRKNGKDAKRRHHGRTNASRHIRRRAPRSLAGPPC